jgi:hypothetical protein
MSGLFSGFKTAISNFIDSLRSKSVKLQDLDVYFSGLPDWSIHDEIVGSIKFLQMIKRESVRDIIKKVSEAWVGQCVENIQTYFVFLKRKEGVLRLLQFAR